MAKKQQTTSINSLNYFAGGPNMDTHENFRDEKGWLSARNATASSPLNDFNSLSNEMSNRLVDSAPYKIIGCVYINDGQWAIFSTDKKNSLDKNNHCEIGIFHENELRYEPFINSNDLNFCQTNLIKGVGRIKSYCHRMAYWDDGLNESRFIDFDDLPWKGEWKGESDGCKEFEYEYDKGFIHQDREHKNPEGKVADIRKMQLSPNTYKGLSFTLEAGEEKGELPNGTYYVVGYYSYNGFQNRLTSYFSISNPQSVFSHAELGSSLRVKVKEVDTFFEEFTIVLHSYFNGQNSTYILGTYSTSTKDILVTQFDRNRVVDNPMLHITENPIPYRTDGIFRIGNEILRIKPTMNQEFNYQPIANRIQTEWVSVKYPHDYYRNGGHNVGYMRDEVYAFFIRWVYNTGEKTKLYHIPGRSAGANNDATAKKYTGTTKTEDGGVLYAHGNMAFWESTERYNDKNHEVWDELCGKRIRHHKFPDNNLSPHFDKNGIYVLGVKFSNIGKPQKFIGFDKFGKKKYSDIDNIIGYEIWRATREGNKSIIAKGMINNMRSYKDTQDRVVYYQNYPYNPVSNPDVFISKEKPLFGDQDKLKYENNVSGDMLTFHSPDLLDDNSGLRHTTRLTGKVLDTYFLLKGRVDDFKYIIPQGAPKQKLMDNKALWSTMILGIGYAMFKMYGVKHTYISTPNIDHGPALAGYGVVELGTGVTSTGLPQAMEQNAGGIAQEAVRLLAEKVKDATRIFGAAGGVDSDNIALLTQTASNLTVGSLSGKGGNVETHNESSPYKEIPGILRIGFAIPLFLTFYGEGMNKVFETLYNLAPYRNYVLQQLSHGYYDNYVLKEKKTYDINDSCYLDDKSFTEFNDIRINNIYRHRTVYVNTERDVPFPSDNGMEVSQVIASMDKDIKRQNLLSYYSALRQPLANQYGKIESLNPQNISFKIVLNDTEGNPTEEPVMFGGDTFIGRYTEKNTFFPFYDWLNGNPDGTGFDYSLYPMLNHPTYWMDCHRYDVENILEKLTGLIKGGGGSSFDPFELNDRYTEEYFVYKDVEYTNTDTVFTDEFFSDYDYSVTKEITLDEQDDINDSLSVDEEQTQETKEQTKEIRQKRLSDFNAKRQCSCLKFTLGDYIKSFATKSQLDAYGHDVSIDSDLLSLNNCKFMDYNGSSNDTVNILSTESNKKAINIKKVWYNQPYKLNSSKFETLCKLKTKVDEASIKVAVAKGYISYLQQTIFDFDNLEDGDTEEYEAAIMVWSKKNDDIKEDLIESLDDQWSDDFAIPYNKDGEKIVNTSRNEKWYGITQGIPYSNYDNKLNPYLMYLIQENTDVVLKYPGFNYDDNSQIWTVNFPNKTKWDSLKACDTNGENGNTYIGYNKGYDPAEVYANLENEESINSLSENKFRNPLDPEGFSVINSNDFMTMMSNMDLWAESIGYDGDELKKSDYKSMSEQICDLYFNGDDPDNPNDTESKYIKLLDLIGDKTYDMTDLKYFCLDDVRKLLSCDKKKRKKNKKLNDYYKYKEDRDEEKHKSSIYKFEKADQLKKAVESKGKLYRKSVKKQQKNYERAYKKYNKTYEKYQKEYNDKISGNTNLFSKIKNTIKEITPAGMYNLDMVGYDPTKEQYSKYRKPKFNLFVRDCYMYQFICGTRDFFVESVQNIDLREWGDSNDKRYYDHLLYNDLDTIYRTDDIKEREYVNFDQSYITDHLLINRLNAYNFSFYQEEKYDEVEAFECRRVFPNRVIYSIPDIDTNISDGWRKWLSGNSRNFNDEVVSIMPHGEHGAIMLFRNSAPIIFSDSAKLSNDNSSVTLRVTQGTGELFNQPMIHLDNVDSIEYGSCQDGFSAMSSPSGNFYVSQEQGKIFTFKKPAFKSENISELSSFSSGLNAWFKHYIPYMLTRDENVFAETKFELYDNTVAGIGYTTSYDNSNGIVYISKKDYRIKPEYRDKMTYFGGGRFRLEDNPFDIMLGDKEYFDDASFTISYDGRIGKTGSFISFHDWHPDMVMNGRDRIFSVKDNGIWRHNDSAYGENCFCNFYGESYPFEVEFNISSENAVSTMRSISYFLECFTYDSNEYDRFHKLFENFDEAVIYNTEQVSGKLELIHREKENPDMITEYPKIHDNGKNSYIEVLWSKEEQRYRFNQFWDITNDRMNEYETMFNTEPNGYVRTINPNYVNYSKDEFERKKFRHRINKVRLVKTHSGNVNLIFSLSMNHNLNSPR